MVGNGGSSKPDHTGPLTFVAACRLPHFHHPSSRQRQEAKCGTEGSPPRPTADGKRTDVPRT